jgi:para-aminobenzoate synthetase component 1
MKIEIKELSKNYNAFYTFKLFKDYKDSVILESLNEDKSLSKYSFIGLNPIWTFKSKGKLSYINDILVDSNNPFDALERQLNNYKIKYDFEVPFIGGAIGYFSYDVGRITEEFKDTANKEINIPDSIFKFYNNIIIFDIINKKTYISDLGLLKENHICNIEAAFNEYKEEEAEFKESDTKFYSNFEKDEYINTILKLKEYKGLGMYILQI